LVRASRLKRWSRFGSDGEVARQYHDRNRVVETTVACAIHFPMPTDD
jgi:hypothetical protein